MYSLRQKSDANNLNKYRKPKTNKQTKAKTKTNKKIKTNNQTNKQTNRQTNILIEIVNWNQIWTEVCVWAFKVELKFNDKTSYECILLK